MTVRLLDPSALKGSVSEGPQSWGEAWSGLAGKTDDVFNAIESTNADAVALEKAYDARITAIRDLTGKDLPNPMRVASGVDKDMAGLLAASAGGGGVAPGLAAFSPDYVKRQQDEFNARARALSGEFRQEIDQIIAPDILQDKYQVMRQAERDAAKAASAPELGALGSFSAQVVGGLTGAAKDPAQWGMAFIGGGASTGRTVAGRIAQTMLTEAVINGGTELMVQAASQNRKKAAGLDYGIANALENAGIAAVFGSAFGGTQEAGSALWRAFRVRRGVSAPPVDAAAIAPDRGLAADAPAPADLMTASVDDTGGAAAMSRVLEGRPEPGDIEMIADAIGHTLTDEDRAMIARSFDDVGLDRSLLPDDASPEEVRLFEVARRYAEDPDNNPPPDILERMMAEQQAGRTRFSADDYERMFSGDQNAVDDIADTFFPDDAMARAAAPDGAPAPVEPRLRPEVAHEPSDVKAMRMAEVQAGLDGADGAMVDFAEPRRDASGNPENYLDFIGLEGDDGRPMVISAREALELADRPNFEADLLEACKL